MCDKREVAIFSVNHADIPVVHILFKNLEEFLPSSLMDSAKTPDGASVIYSIQIGQRSAVQPSEVLKDNPISLNFTFNAVSVSYVHVSKVLVYLDMGELNFGSCIVARHSFTVYSSYAGL